ncbi:MAG: endonuclease MutS2 [Prevotellaceae bacterium]|jgi:DNA mismatch repair protein MutS2|nr:endonuclease MutS2 [Prevotellaceae bacterium]
MIYPNNFEQKIGFDRIRQLLAAHCLSPLGAERVDEVSFSDRYATVDEWLRQTSEFVRILQAADAFPDQYFFDVRPSLQRIRVEGMYLSENEVFDLRRSLETIRDILRFLVSETDETPYPALHRLTEGVMAFPKLIQTIDRILDKYGKVKDTASSELQRIRRELAGAMNGISRTLNRILHAAQSDGIVEKDVVPAMRDGRLVIPVVPGLKRKIKGIVHDESATGKTVFIEPTEVVEANNRIRELENEERREIIRILTAFSNSVRPAIPEILNSYVFLAEIDLIRAKAKLAMQMNALFPSLTDACLLDWRSAVHPLLRHSLAKQDKQVVPLDIELAAPAQRILIISGPNAGGKSVCLKTVGLLQYMLQCGLPIPIHESSRAGIFKHIFIDIGDEQSIEDDLSTYSSHLTNMKAMMRHCDGESLILIDEFGGGTEPQIGGAIAEAVLKRFNSSGAYGVITTHYQNLKHYAEDHEGIRNAAMLYDRHLMRPLFQLQIGNPGSSFAVEIARKIGLPEEVIADASEIVGSVYINADKYLQDIVRDKRYWETKRQEIRRQEKQMEATIARYEADTKELQQSRKEIIRQAREQAEQLLQETNARIENTIREIKEVQAEKTKTREIRQELTEFQQQLTEKKEQHTEKKTRAGEKKKPSTVKKKPIPQAAPITLGDTVRLKGQTAIGHVLELNDKQAVVAFGHLKSTVSLDRLEHAQTSQQTSVSRASVGSRTHDSMYEKKLNFKQDLDVRGMRGDEALQAVSYFIDDAILIGMQRVRILHGTGTGILRQLIRSYLKTVGGVRHFEDEHVQLGGVGITVVDLL